MVIENKPEMHSTIKKLYFEPTSRCNLKCVMCFRKTWIDESFGDLPLDLFYKTINDSEALRDAKTVFFGGMGEPLVHPHIFEMIRASHERGFNVEMITNGTMLTSQTAQKLIENGLNKLWISVDSFDDEHYGTIQVGSNFSLIRRNIESFNEARHDTDVKLGITFVVMRDNIMQLPFLEHFVDKMHIDDVNLSHMIPASLEEAEQTLWTLTESSEMHQAYPATRAVSWHQSDGIYDTEPERSATAGEGDLPRFRFRMYDLPRLGNEEELRALLDDDLCLTWKGEMLWRKKHHCRFVAEGNCFVRWDGDVSPCMGLLHSAKTCLNDMERVMWHYSFGNIGESTLADIWENEEYAAFRERVVKFDFSPCSDCGGCEFREFNEEDCFGNTKPTCGACLWGQGLARCP